MPALFHGTPVLRSPYMGRSGANFVKKKQFWNLLQSFYRNGFAIFCQLHPVKPDKILGYSDLRVRSTIGIITTLALLPDLPVFQPEHGVTRPALEGLLYDRDYFLLLDRSFHLFVAVQ